MTQSTKDCEPWNRWQLLAGLTLAGIGVAVNGEIWADMLHIAARDAESSHIFLVPLVAAWLVWMRRDRLVACCRRHTLIGPCTIALGWLVSSVGYHYAVQSFWHGGAVLVLIGCILSVAGRDVLAGFLPAFAVLVFLVPVPGMARQTVAIPLQTITARVAQAVLVTLDFDIQRSGNVLHVNGVDVAIAEACNGMRMVFALVLVAYAFAFSTQLSTFARTLVLVGSPLVAIFCNVIRLLPSVWLYGYYPPTFAAWFHEISGWLMLPVALLVLMGMTRLVRWAWVPTG